MPSPQEYFALAMAFRGLQEEIKCIEDRVDRRLEFTKPDHTETEFKEEIESVADNMSDLAQILDDFSTDEEVCQNLKKDIEDLLPVLDAFSGLCAEIQEKHWADIEGTQREYFSLIAEYLPEVGTITRRGNDGTAQRVLAGPDLDWSTKRLLGLLLQIYDGLIDYWLLWRWVYTYPTGAEVRGDH